MPIVVQVLIQDNVTHSSPGEAKPKKSKLEGTPTKKELQQFSDQLVKKLETLSTFIHNIID
jgi:hypothetical protein